MDKDYEVYAMPAAAVRVYECSRGLDALEFCGAVIEAMDVDPDDEQERLDAMAEPLVHQLHAACECGEEYIAALLYASGLLAMTAYGQLEISSQLAGLRGIDGPDDLEAR